MENQVKCNVQSNAEGEWQRRVQQSNDFENFKILHLVVKPAIIYEICKNSSLRQTMQFITKLSMPVQLVCVTVAPWDVVTSHYTH